MSARAKTTQRSRVGGARRAEAGSVLIMVIWVCLGLVALTVYFADAMTAEMRAADNRMVEIAARQAAAGGTRYAAFILSQFGTNGTIPYVDEYRAEEVPVGDANFWLIGRDNNQRPTEDPVFGLVDEASKINLNTAPRSMLEALPGMTPELADAILTWRSRSQAGMGDNTYSRLEPPRVNKGGPFETVDELRLVYGATLDLLFGEDANRNGALDDNENDADQAAPRDNADGLLQPGILEYVTVYSREPNTRANGQRRINIAAAPARLQFLQQRFGGRGQQIAAAIGPGEMTSVAEFMVASRLSAEEFAQIRGDITVSTGTTIQGLINVNTASETVLACIPGIGPDSAAALVAYRQANPDTTRGTFTWITNVLSRGAITRAGRYLTDRSYQFTADVVAVGISGRGYCRTKTVFDMTKATPRIIYHQDLSAYGWALGNRTRLLLRETRENRL